MAICVLILASMVVVEVLALKRHIAMLEGLAQHNYLLILGPLVWIRLAVKRALPQHTPMRYLVLITLAFTACAQARPQPDALAEMKKDTTAAIYGPQSGASTSQRSEQSANAVWEDVKPAAAAYMNCTLNSAQKLALQPESPDHIAIAVLSNCHTEHARMRERFALFHGSQRAYLFGEAMKSSAKENIIGFVVQVRAKARRYIEEQRRKAQEKTPLKKGQDI